MVQLMYYLINVMLKWQKYTTKIMKLTLVFNVFFATITGKSFYYSMDERSQRAGFFMFAELKQEFSSDWMDIVNNTMIDIKNQTESLGVVFPRLIYLSVITEGPNSNEQFIKTNISQKLDEVFEYCASKNLSIIFRSYYSSGEPSDFNLIEKDVNDNWVPFLIKHAKKLFVLQAGWLGAGFGEWWGTERTPDNDIGTDEIVKTSKMKIIDPLLKVPDVAVSLRSPKDIANYYAGKPRVSFHDDCILADGPGGNDQGTWDKASAKWPANSPLLAKKFMQTELRGLVGGEACPGLGLNKTTCQDFLDFVRAFRVSYLNMGFPPHFKELIMKNKSCYETLHTEMQINLQKSKDQLTSEPNIYIAFIVLTFMFYFYF